MFALNILLCYSIYAWGKQSAVYEQRGPAWFPPEYPFQFRDYFWLFGCNVCLPVFSSILYIFLPKVKLVMQILGAAYMLYLAWKVWKSSADFNAEGGNEASFVSRMVLQFMNPKIYI